MTAVRAWCIVLYHAVSCVVADLACDLLAAVFGVVVQNNPLCQDWALEFHGLTTVIGLLAPHEEPAVVKSGLFALASLVKGHSTATEKFLHADGLQLLTNLLSYPRSTSSIQM